jgi:hypothetical protein
MVVFIQLLNNSSRIIFSRKITIHIGHSLILCLNILECGFCLRITHGHRTPRIELQEVIYIVPENKPQAGFSFIWTLCKTRMELVTEWVASRKIFSEFLGPSTSERFSLSCSRCATDLTIRQVTISSVVIWPFTCYWHFTGLTVKMASCSSFVI